MKLKKQLNLLAVFITAIPLACLLFVCINLYLRSPRHMLLSGYEEIQKLDSTNMTKADYDLFIRNVKLLPKNVEIALIDNITGLVITSTIKEIPTNSYVSQFELWLIMEGNSNKYFYQFTSLNTYTLNSIQEKRVLQ